MVKSLGLRLLCNVSDDICVYFQKEEDGEDAVDKSADNLSHVGKAAYECLRTKHEKYHHMLWNVTSGRVIGEIMQSPNHAGPEGDETKTDDSPELNITAKKNEISEGHSDWFPEKLFEIISRTKFWCDILSLGPPDGMFVPSFNNALKKIHETAEKEGRIIVVRMIFGNIPGMPVNCHKVIKKLRHGIPKTSNLRLWVGSWRKAVTWNHSKIIAVDGQFLWTGGHNLWDAHYLKTDPVHDLSIEMEGRVTNDAHCYANEQWAFIQDCQDTIIGKIIDKFPDYLPMVMEARVTVSAFPRKLATEFPPMYTNSLIPICEKLESDIPVLSLGRYGSLQLKDRPSDDAFVAMFDSAEKSIRLTLQDLGPVCIPGTKTPLPGCRWPKEYLSAFARAIWLKGVDVEIVLSNPGSVPGGLKPLEACYGNGWSCVDVAAEIIKRLRKQFPEADDDQVRQKITDNLRICFIRREYGNTWADDLTIAMHSKHFIIDDICTYVGSQNLYICDLAEWGVFIDDADETKKIMEKYWNPMWKYSFTGEDCKVQDVLDGQNVNRDNDDSTQTAEVAANTGVKPTDHNLYGDSDDDEEDSDLEA